MIVKRGMIYLKAQIFNRDHEGEDIIVTDKRGVNWQIQDKAKVLLPKCVVCALERAITDRLVIQNKVREVKKEPRYIVVRLPEDAKLDSDDASDIEDAAVEEALLDKKKRQGNVAPGKNPKAKQQAAKKKAEKILEDIEGSHPEDPEPDEGQDDIDNDGDVEE